MSAALVQDIKEAADLYQEYDGLAPLDLVIEGLGTQSGMACVSRNGLVHMLPFTWEDRRDRLTGQNYRVVTGYAETGWLIDPTRVIAYRFADQVPPTD